MVFYEIFQPKVGRLPLMLMCENHRTNEICLYEKIDTTNFGHFAVASYFFKA